MEPHTEPGTQSISRTLEENEDRLLGPPPGPEAVAALSGRLAAQGWLARAQGDLLVLQPQGRP